MSANFSFGKECFLMTMLASHFWKYIIDFPSPPNFAADSLNEGTIIDKCGLKKMAVYQ
jgi:hypothetical protein